MRRPLAWGTVALAMASAPAWADDGAARERGRVLFGTAQPPCAVCHTLKAAGATGTVGPVLDELQPDAERVLRALRNGVGVMPVYGELLPEEDLRALAAYVAGATGGAPLPAGR